MKLGLKFPNTPEKPGTVWVDGDWYIAFVDKGKYIKLYYWDGISMAWNKMQAFEKEEQ
mgnify:CR=1 FL=1